MFDCRGKQGIGLMLGVFSIVIPYAPFLALRALLDIATLFVILIIGLVIGTIGIIVSSISLKEAGELGIRRAKSITGLALNIYGTGTCLVLGIIFGLTAIFSMKMIEAGFAT